MTFPNTNISSSTGTNDSNDNVWSTFINQSKHCYLNCSEHLISAPMSIEDFSALFILEDRKQTLINIKALLKLPSYKKFLNQYRVYKSRFNASTTQMSISKYNFDNLNLLTQQLGYQSNNETIELLWSYYVESHADIPN